jgi:hypothetical protein
MLRVPQVIVDVAPPGLLRREAESALELFRDPRRGGVVLVTLAEDMPVNESIELYAAIDGELGMPVQKLVVNGVLPRLFEREERPLYRGLEKVVGAESPLTTLAAASRTRVIREEVQEESIARLMSEIPIARIELPHLFVPEFRRAAIESLSRAF